MMKILGNQICCDAGETSLKGQKLMDALYKQYPDLKEIPAGCVIVNINNKVGSSTRTLFQLLTDTPIDTLREFSIMYFEPGSIYYWSSSSTYRPSTFRFRDCRFPTFEEYIIYEKNNML